MKKVRHIVGIAALLLADSRAAMHAAIHQDMNVAVLIASHDRGLGSNRHRLVVTRRADLVLMADENPVAFENALHLQIKDLLLEIDLSMDPGLLHQFFEVQI